MLVTVHAVAGSSPREVGAWMAVFAADAVGTVGGGHLEFEAMVQARALLARSALLTPPNTGLPAAALDLLQRRFALGPSLGQCCGGVVDLRFELLTPSIAARLARTETARCIPVAVFGCGHVGRALMACLAPLPFSVSGFDSREALFAQGDAAHWHGSCTLASPLHDAVPDLVPGTLVLIMSHSHAEDFDVVAACLMRQRQQRDLAFIGLIGSRSKWASFQSRLLARGFAAAELAQVICPIGVSGVVGKEPQVIAVAVAAQLLGLRAKLAPPALPALPAPPVADVHASCNAVPAPAGIA